LRLRRTQQGSMLDIASLRQICTDEMKGRGPALEFANNIVDPTNWRNMAIPCVARTFL
jgi:hypothetical protein